MRVNKPVKFLVDEGPPPSSSKAKLLKDDSAIHLPSLVENQITANQKRQDKLTAKLPEKKQSLIFSFKKDFDDLQRQFLEMPLPANDEQWKLFSGPLNASIKDLTSKYRDFGFASELAGLIGADDLTYEVIKFVFEVSKNMLINTLIYHEEVLQLVEEHRDMILKEFAPSNVSLLLVGSIKYDISFQNTKTDKLIERPYFGEAPSETHHFGKAPAFITFHADGQVLFRVVYKPRDALIDKAVIDTFEAINLLPALERSSEVPLPIYKILNFKKQSLWEYIDGKDISKKKIVSAGMFVRRIKGKRGLRAQERLNRLDAVLTKMQISDLHKENVIIRYLNDLTKDVEIVPVDLENRQGKVATQLGGKPNEVALTTAEVEVIHKSFEPMAKSVPSRYLPLSTNRMALFIRDLEKVESFASILMKQFEHDGIRTTMTKTGLQERLITSIINNDIPYFTNFQGVLYYGDYKKGEVIGKWERAKKSSSKTMEPEEKSVNPEPAQVSQPFNPEKKATSSSEKIGILLQNIEELEGSQSFQVEKVEKLFLELKEARSLFLEHELESLFLNLNRRLMNLLQESVKKTKGKEAIPVMKGKLYSGTLNQFSPTKRDGTPWPKEASRASCTVNALTFLSRAIHQPVRSLFQENDDPKKNKVNEIVDDGRSSFERILKLRKQELAKMVKESNISQKELLWEYGGDALHVSEIPHIEEQFFLTRVRTLDTIKLVKDSKTANTTVSLFQSLLEDIFKDLVLDQPLGAVLQCNGSSYGTVLHRASDGLEISIFDSHGSFVLNRHGNAFVYLTEGLKDGAWFLGNLIKFDDSMREDIESEEINKLAVILFKKKLFHS